ncbi:hypothetical protein [Acinetobacter sp.]|uniref:hypothetical protein n=1 Tax=Acinetobacter sp. TaxID=472 RepID=UPI00258F4A5E|nr:hypothetical protein [Acinetobacter sp.]
MKLIIPIFLLLTSSSYANEADECKIIEETADMIMQLRQGGIDLKAIDLKDQLNPLQNDILQKMIIEAEAIPIYATDLDKQNAVDVFVEDWKKFCIESGY